MTKVISLRKKKVNKNKSSIYKERKNKRINLLNEEKYKLFFLLISIIGVLAGAICYRLTENTQISQIVVESFNVLNSGEFKAVFLYLIKFDLIFILISFFIGTSFIGSSISFFAPMLKCLYVGYFSGYLYNDFELKGVLFCLLLLFPCFAITTTSLIFASNENVYMSQYIYKSLNGKTSIDNISIRLYLLRYLLLVAINIFCIIITSLLIAFIGPKINII